MFIVVFDCYLMVNKVEYILVLAWITIDTRPILVTQK